MVELSDNWILLTISVVLRNPQPSLSRSNPSYFKVLQQPISIVEGDLSFVNARCVVHCGSSQSDFHNQLIRFGKIVAHTKPTICKHAYAITNIRVYISKVVSPGRLDPDKVVFERGKSVHKVEISWGISSQICKSQGVVAEWKRGTGVVVIDWWRREQIRRHNGSTKTVFALTRVHRSRNQNILIR